MIEKTPASFVSAAEANTEPFALLKASLRAPAAAPPIQRDIARPLAMAFIDALPENQRPFATEIATALWPKNASLAPALMDALKAKIADISNPDAQQHAAEILAKLGHLHQLAGMALRERELAAATTATTAQAFLTGKLGKKTVPGYTTAAAAVDALNAPRIELTFTAHPTNTNSQSSMLAQRDLGMALSAFAIPDSNTAALKSALKAYASAPLLPEIQPKTSLPGRTVREETQNMLYHLNAVYDDLDGVYRGYDKALDEKFNTITPAYDPRSLQLNLGFHSWGSSADKDGNANVNADSTLFAFAMHHQHIVQKYLNGLQRINDPALQEWQKTLEIANTQLTTITKTLEEKLAASGHISEAEHDALRAQLIRAVGPLDCNAFTADLHTAYAQQTHPQNKRETLSLLRHARIFGMSFGTLEYRETAEEFTRIIGALIPDYESANEATRQQLLNTVLADPQKMAKLSCALKTLGHGKEASTYSDTDLGPIAYHTRKRLELARDFPAAITDHVLAECQHSSNLLELLVLQHAVAEGNKKPLLGIIALFEDREPVQRAPEILKTTLENPYYLSHIHAIQAQRGQQKPAQQIQLAHSDNARRNGLPAARALIYDAHQQLRSAMQAINQTHPYTPIDLQFYEGGSLTDSYRGGTRAILASINEFSTHGFTKLTAQGGDLLNHFNLPHSTYRVLMRAFTHNAVRLKNPTGTERLGEEKIIAALTKCSDDYKELFEGKHAPILNGFLESIDFAAEASAGNVSSRAGKRGNGTRSVDATKVRTISFSEGCQHAGLNPSWIGSLALRTNMRAEGIDADNPATLKKLYETLSPVFKDTIDRMIFGIVRTDMDYLRECSGNHPLLEQRLKREYEAAFNLCVEAYTGKTVAELSGGKAHVTPEEQKRLLIDLAYPHMRDVFADQDRYTQLVRTLKTAASTTETHHPTHGNAMAILRTTLHNAGDTIIHGRLPLIDDPTYATLYCNSRDIARPHAAAALPAQLRA